MLRELGKIETAAAYCDEKAIFNITAVFFMEGLPAKKVIRRALDILQKRHPFLQVRLTQVNGQFLFEKGGVPPIPLNVSTRENDETWMRVVEERISTNFDLSRGPLLKCDLITDGKLFGEIILTAQHSIADSTSLRGLFAQLMEICQHLDEGVERVEIDPIQALPPVETTFPQPFQNFSLTSKIPGYLFREMSQELSYQLKMRREPNQVIAPKSRVKILISRMSEKDTRAIVRQARKRRVTLFSTIHAAMLLSVQKHLYDGEARLFRYYAPTDLRSYVKPPPPANRLGCYISMLRLTLALESGEDFWDTARRVNQQIYESSKRGDKYLAAILTKQVLRMVFRQEKIRIANTGVTSSGPSQLVPAYGPFRVTGWRGFVSNFGHGPEFVAHISITNDELWLDFMYLEVGIDAEIAQQLTDEVMTILANAVGA